jgi:hypothetical protein
MHTRTIRIAISGAGKWLALAAASLFFVQMLANSRVAETDRSAAVKRTSAIVVFAKICSVSSKSAHKGNSFSASVPGASAWTPETFEISVLQPLQRPCRPGVQSFIRSLYQHGPPEPGSLLS